MHILVANWSWYPTGGDWTYIDNLSRLYEQHGHTVIPFSTQNSRNFDTPFSEYFVRSYDFKELNKNKSPANALRAVKTSVRSGDAVRKLNSLLDKYPVRLAHLHNIHHYLTPAIIEVLQNRGVKIIWTLHDYKIICPENSFVSNGKICEACLGGKFYHCAANRCKKNSRAASLLASIEAYYYHRKKTYTLVDYYLCPSEFMRQKFIRFGFSPDKLIVTNLCYDINLIDKFLTQPENRITERYILYVGRLEVIKGLKTLIRAVKDTPVKLRIAGTGPAETELKTLAGWPENPNIVFEGFCTKDKVFELTRNALSGVCPSEWYENLPYSVSETFLFSKPVVGARIGGIPELVLDGKTGLLFESGNPNDLREKLMYIWQNQFQTEEMGKNARKHAEEMYAFGNHWKKLNPIIQQLNP